VSTGGRPPRVRVGQGIDVHPLVEGRPLVLGGVHVPYERGLAGHSDADVAAHAACDALLGGAGLGDLGRHFVAGDPRWAGLSSLEFCRRVAKMVAGAGWSVGNLSVTVLCDRPRIGALVPRMEAALAGAFGLDLDQVQVIPKATEGLAFTGRGEGIAAMAVCLLTGSGDDACGTETKL
jgi:2-C-methyl-D-erythritol 2,4-cyclodiphosphate synthase